MSSDSESLINAKLKAAKEKERYYEIFKMFDKKKKGSFGVKELVEVMKLYGMSPNEQEALEMILVIDTDGDGKITFEEFLNVFLQRLKDSTEAQDELREAFRVFDKESNGFVSVEELRQALTECGEKLTEEEVQEMVREISSPDSRNINYEELITIMTSGRK